MATKKRVKKTKLPPRNRKGQFIKKSRPRTGARKGR